MQLVLRGQDGTVVPLGDEPITLGRDRRSTLRVLDERASRIHCVVQPDAEGQVRVCDLGSRNGTWVNGVEVYEAALTTGDVLRVGRTEFVVQERKQRAGKAVGEAEDEAWLDRLRILAHAQNGNGNAAGVLEVVGPKGRAWGAIDGPGPGAKATRLMLMVAVADQTSEAAPVLSLVPMGKRYELAVGQSNIEIPSRIGLLMLGFIRVACQVRGDDLPGDVLEVRSPGQVLKFRARFERAPHGRALHLERA